MYQLSLFQDKEVYTHKVSKVKYNVIQKFDNGLCICKRVEPDLLDILNDDVEYYIYESELEGLNTSV